MNVTVRFFSFLRDAVGMDSCVLNLMPGDSGLEVRERLRQRYLSLVEVLDYCRLAVNHEYQSWEIPLQEGDELGLIPPVSGG